MGFLRKLTGGTDTKLLQTGLPGRGVILSVTPSGTTVQMGGGMVERACQFRVQVTLDGRAPYEATCKQRVAEVYIPQFQPGSSVVAVRANPENLAEIAVDFEHEPPTVTMARTEGAVTVADIIATGRPAKGVIIQSQPLGMKNPDGVDMYGFVLTVMPDGEAPYQTQVGNPTPPEALPLLFPGSHVPVKLQLGGTPTTWSSTGPRPCSTPSRAERPGSAPGAGQVRQLTTNRSKPSGSTAICRSPCSSRCTSSDGQKKPPPGVKKCGEPTTPRVHALGVIGEHTSRVGPLDRHAVGLGQRGEHRGVGQVGALLEEQVA